MSAVLSLTGQVPVQYWRATLAQARLMHPEVPPDREPIEINVDEHGWFIARAPGGVRNWVQEQFDASPAAGPARPPLIPLVLVPARLSEHASHGAKPMSGDIHTGVSVICLPALLDREGGLHPDRDRHPWIPRELLSPTLSPVALGKLADFDNFISRLPPQAASFGDTLHAASAMLDAVAGAWLPLLPWDESLGDPPPLLEVPGHELVSQWHGLPYEPPVIAHHILRLCDHLIAEQPSTPLLQSLSTIAHRPSSPPVALSAAEPWHAKSVGHISNRHPLSPSQREAMVEMVRGGNGQILSVNGPPGTGKTTLLQSVVAQHWVSAALAESTCPLVLVTSTNGKAVENVLESFARIGTEIGHQRWHPYEGGFGLFLASESRETTHPVCTGVGQHPFAEHETAQGVELAQAHYLGRASAVFGVTQVSVDAVVRTLHRLLQEHARTLARIVKARYELFEATGQGPSDGASASCRAMIAQLQAAAGAAQKATKEAQARIEQFTQQASAVVQAAKDQREPIFSAEKSWVTYLAKSPLWMDLLAVIPAVRRRRAAKDRAALLSNPLTAAFKDRETDVCDHLAKLRAAIDAKETQDLASIAEQQEAAKRDEAAASMRAARALEAVKVVDAALAKWLAALGPYHAELHDASLENLNDSLDLRLRAPMFSLADWYWSGRWILTMQDRLAAGEKDSRGRQRKEAMLRRFAMLSPCLVSNFHKAPDFFIAWQGNEMPMWNTIDLLVVDEAGQVAPEVGAPTFALAKRALVVGDVYQIEPVWGVEEGVDRANASAVALTAQPHDAKYDELARAGYTSAAGSLMHMANRACTVQMFPEVRGLMLTEHRRCVPELIRYCNELIYAGRLLPMRPALPAAQRLLPTFGWLDVRGRDQRAGTSRENPQEAKAVVAWLKANRDRIEQHYRDEQGNPTPLWKLVGVVTPFTTQARAIDRELRQVMPDLTRRATRLTVGTVHALQGAERAIVVFSPTYGAEFRGGAFFDRTPNMLNVAVSRAKDSLLVIGNLALFDAARANRPSGLLGRFLQGNAGRSLADTGAPVSPSM